MPLVVEQVQNLLHVGAGGIGAGGRGIDVVLADVIARLTGPQPVVGALGDAGYIPATTAAEFQNDLVQHATPADLNQLLTLPDAQFAQARKQQLVTALAAPAHAAKADAVLQANPANAALVVQHGDEAAINGLLASGIGADSKTALVTALAGNAAKETTALANPRSAAEIVTHSTPAHINDLLNLNIDADAVVVAARVVAARDVATPARAIDPDGHAAAVAAFPAVVNATRAFNTRKTNVFDGLAANPAKLNEVIGDPAVPANAQAIITNGTAQQIGALLQSGASDASKEALVGQLLDNANNAKLQDVLALPNGAGAIVGAGTPAQLNGLFNRVDAVVPPVVALNAVQKEAFITALAANHDKADTLIAANPTDANFMVGHGNPASIRNLLHTGNDASKTALVGALAANPGQAATVLYPRLGIGPAPIPTEVAAARTAAFNAADVIIEKATDEQLARLEANDDIAGGGILKIAKAARDMNLTPADRGLFDAALNGVPADKLDGAIAGIKKIKEGGLLNDDGFTAALRDISNKPNPNDRIGTIDAINNAFDSLDAQNKKKLSDDIDRNVKEQNKALDKSHKSEIAELEQESAKDRGQGMKLAAGCGLLIFIGIALLPAAPILGALVLAGGAMAGANSMGNYKAAGEKSAQIHEIKSDITEQKTQNAGDAEATKALHNITKDSVRLAKPSNIVSSISKVAKLAPEVAAFMKAERGAGMTV